MLIWHLVEKCKPHCNWECSRPFDLHIRTGVYVNVLVPAKLDYMDYMNTKELLDIDIYSTKKHMNFFLGTFFGVGLNKCTTLS